MEPPTIDHFLGQPRATELLRVALEASWNDSSRLPHSLLLGPPGIGKTALARVAGRELGVKVHERLAQVLYGLEAVNGLLLEAEDKEVVFIDEVHEMPESSQVVLYKAMDDQTIFVNHHGDKSMALPIADFTLIAATTDEYRLLGPLLDRFKLVLPFSYYDDDSLAKIVLQRAAMTRVQLEPAVAHEIARRSRGTPRLAIRLLESCHRFARSRGDEKTTQSHFDETVAMEQIDELGLGIREQRILRLLAENPGQPLRLFNIGAALGIHQRSLQSVVEPFLIRSGLIQRTEQGRQITEKGLRHLGHVEEAQGVGCLTSGEDHGEE